MSTSSQQRAWHAHSRALVGGVSGREIAPPVITSIAAKGDHRIDAQGAPGRPQRGKADREKEQDYGADVGDRIDRAQAIQLPPQQLGQPGGSQNAQDQTPDDGSPELTEETPQDVTGFGAQGQTDSNFLRALRNRVGHQTHDAQTGYGQRDHAEHADREGAALDIAGVLVELV